MTIEEILRAWKVEAKLDPTKYVEHLRQLPSLRVKYFGLRLDALDELRAAEKAHAKVLVVKHTVYEQGPSKEERYQYKKFPAKGAASSKRELDIYLDADEELQASKDTVLAAKKKVTVLDEILDEIKARGFNIKHILDWKKYESGEN